MRRRGSCSVDSISDSLKFSFGAPPFMGTASAHEGTVYLAPDVLERMSVSESQERRFECNAYFFAPSWQ